MRTKTENKSWNRKFMKLVKKVDVEFVIMLREKFNENKLLWK